jgi:hypothetical protein
LPLGEAYSGVCRAGGEPSEDQQFELCNHGYARGRCESFPNSSPADAVRFSITCDEPLRLVYILEKNHAPLEFGEFAPNQILAAQARAFLSSHARLRG